MANYTIYAENYIIGTRLSLGNENSPSKEFNRWAVKDDLNGQSIPTEIYDEDGDKAKALGRFSDYIYGFYKPGNTVTLTLYSSNTKAPKKEETIEVVKILSRKVADLDA